MHPTAKWGTTTYGLWSHTHTHAHAHPVTHYKFIMCFTGVQPAPVPASVEAALALARVGSLRSVRVRELRVSAVPFVGRFVFTTMWKWMCIICQHKSLASVHWPLPPRVSTPPLLACQQQFEDSTLLICLLIECYIRFKDWLIRLANGKKSNNRLANTL